MAYSLKADERTRAVFVAEKITLFLVAVVFALVVVSRTTVPKAPGSKLPWGAGLSLLPPLSSPSLVKLIYQVPRKGAFLLMMWKLLNWPFSASSTGESE